MILDEIYKPYVRTAWAKGLTGAQVMTRHVLPNALVSTLRRTLKFFGVSA